ncbi:MAG: RecB family endonuclease NucS [Candidatus Methanohalarchaeum thermophilum]|uniref:RecB family endonuclease NucS n=1 Tax=Methanohalarchaeum thermophilum TaxID=1903181 RepID=A0A1Q6DVY5_METT1|nr:MAG: RecB family endonuclease NucS [Candidatus Methanohalarchaeum thermophilum]
MDREEIISKVEEVSSKLNGEFTAGKVIDKINSEFEEDYGSTKVRNIVIACSDHPSSKFHDIEKKLFKYLGKGKYRVLGEKEDLNEPEATKKNEPSFKEKLKETKPKNEIIDLIEEKINTLKGNLTPHPWQSRDVNTITGQIDLLYKDKEGNTIAIDYIDKKAGIDKAKEMQEKIKRLQKNKWIESDEIKGILICKNLSNELKNRITKIKDIKCKKLNISIEFESPNQNS